MARKRGGLAGLYDRNKGLVRTAATIGGSLLGGPAAGAAIGAAFRGLDREGKSGIGFDVGQGLRGAAEGYTTGKLTGAAKSSIGKMLAPKMPAGALNMDVINADIARGLGGSTVPTAAAPSGTGMTNIMLPKATMADRPLTRMIDAERISGAVTPQMAAPDIGALSRGVAGGGGGGGGGGGSLMGSIGRRATEAMDFANKYEKPLGGIAKGIMGQMPNAATEAQMAANELAREKMAFEQRQIEEENLRRQNMARMLMPQLDRILGLNAGSPQSRDFGASGYTPLASIQGAVPGFGSYANFDEEDGSPVAPLRTSVSPLRTSTSPLRTSVNPLRTSVSPLRTSVNPLR